MKNPTFKMSSSFVLFAIFLGQLAWAVETDHKNMKNHLNHKHEHKEPHEAGAQKISKSEAIIKVNGMVCSFCAQGIKNNFNKQKEVKETKVDLDKMEVHVKFKEGQSLDKNKIEKIITDAGFKYIGMKSE